MHKSILTHNGLEIAKNYHYKCYNDIRKHCIYGFMLLRVFVCVGALDRIIRTNKFALG